MNPIKANSPSQELEWALCELRRSREDVAEAVQKEELAVERVRKAREALWQSDQAAATVIGCACVNESCYLALKMTTMDGTKRFSVVGNEARLAEPVVILDAKGIDILRQALGPVTHA